MPLSGLSPALLHPHTETAQRFLASAYDSVEAALDALEVVVAERRAPNPTARGALTAHEQDLLRAAILFAGAGLDAALKQLIRDALPYLLDSNIDAQRRFERFTARAVADGEHVSRSRLARYLSAVDPRAALVSSYVEELTGSSLQSVDQIRETAAALGLSNSNDRELYRLIGEFRALVVARNQIAHELDLVRPTRPGDRSRRGRTIETSTALAHRSLEVGQRIINAVVEALS